MTVLHRIGRATPVLLLIALTTGCGSLQRVGQVGEGAHDQISVGIATAADQPTGVLDLSLRRIAALDAAAEDNLATGGMRMLMGRSWDGHAPPFIFQFFMPGYRHTWARNHYLGIELGPGIGFTEYHANSHPWHPGEKSRIGTAFITELHVGTTKSTRSAAYFAEVGVAWIAAGLFRAPSMLICPTLRIGRYH